MFSKKILESQDYLELSKGARCLYISLNMAADDEGFVNNAEPIMRMIDATEDEFDELIRAGYILPVFPKIQVITHWHIHNSISKSRLRSTTVTNWREMLDLQDDVYRPKVRF